MIINIKKHIELLTQSRKKQDELEEKRRKAAREYQKRYYYEKVQNDPEAMERRRKIAYEWYLKQDHEAHCAKQRERRLATKLRNLKEEQS